MGEIMGRNAPGMELSPSLRGRSALGLRTRGSQRAEVNWTPAGLPPEAAHSELALVANWLEKTQLESQIGFPDCFVARSCGHELSHLVHNSAHTKAGSAYISESDKPPSPS